MTAGGWAYIIFVSGVTVALLVLVVTASLVAYKRGYWFPR